LLFPSPAKGLALLPPLFPLRLQMAPVLFESSPVHLFGQGMTSPVLGQGLLGDVEPSAEFPVLQALRAPVEIKAVAISAQTIYFPGPTSEPLGVGRTFIQLRTNFVNFFLEAYAFGAELLDPLGH